MNIVLTGRDEQFVERLVASGRYPDEKEVIRAGLRKLEREGEVTGQVAEFPPGSLLHLFSDEHNAEELRILEGCSLLIEE